MSIAKAIEAPDQFTIDSNSAVASSGVSYSVNAVDDKGITTLFGGSETAAGESVDPYSALCISAFFNGVSILSSSIAGLPIDLIGRGRDGTRTPAEDHYITDLLLDRPNPATSWYVFRETLGAHAVSWGNAFAFIERARAGRILGLWQITPNRVKIDLDDETGLPSYLVDGKERFDFLDILHVPGLGFDGLCGYQLSTIARESLALAKATEKYGASFFGNSARPSGFLKHSKTLSQKSREGLKTSWEKLYKGSGNQHKVALLEEGLDFTPLTVPPETAQFLESRQFSIVEIARWLNLPPHMLKHLEQATQNNMEFMGTDFLRLSLMPWINRWEGELHYKLLGPEERRGLYFRHQVGGLLRATTRERYEGYGIARQWGWLSVNDIRRLEDLPPIKGGDTYLLPLNMVPANKLGDNGKAEYKLVDREGRIHEPSRLVDQYGRRIDSVYEGVAA
ncbi:MAG: phage portal protein [Gemmataceae bacterium]